MRSCDVAQHALFAQQPGRHASVLGVFVTMQGADGNRTVAVKSASPTPRDSAILPNIILLDSISSAAGRIWHSLSHCAAICHANIGTSHRARHFMHKRAVFEAEKYPWRLGSDNIDLLVNNPCHCFLISRHRKRAVPSEVHISTRATYNLPPSLRWRSGKYAFLMNNDNAIWCY